MINNSRQGAAPIDDCTPDGTAYRGETATPPTALRVRLTEYQFGVRVEDLLRTWNELYAVQRLDLAGGLDDERAVAEHLPSRVRW
jgi:hypothetical protein